jgi:hypothetical protein
MIVAKDALRTELDSTANTLICEKYLADNGPKKDFISRSNKHYVIYNFSE